MFKKTQYFSLGQKQTFLKIPSFVQSQWIGTTLLLLFVTRYAYCTKSCYTVVSTNSCYTYYTEPIMYLMLMVVKTITSYKNKTWIVAFG